MGKTRSSNGIELKRGPWTPEEDKKLFAYIEKNGHRNWSTLPQKAGLQRCGKSCRIRWINYLRPDIKRGKITPHEEQTIIQLHALLGNRWSVIAAFLTNRTDNEIKNYWNCRLKKRLSKMGIDPSTHKRKSAHETLGLSNDNEPKNAAKIIHMAQWESTRLEAEARLVKKAKKLENKQLNSLVESEILSNLKAMPHSYLCTFDRPHEQVIASKPMLPPCLDILKAWESVSLDHADYFCNNSSSLVENAVDIFPSMNDLNIESFFSGCIQENQVVPSNDIWSVNQIDFGSQSCFEDFWDILPCNSDDGTLVQSQGLFSNNGRRPGEELLFECNLSYCGKVGSLLMH